MNYLTSQDLMKIKDSLPTEEVRNFIKEAKKRDNCITFKGIFISMGYKLLFGDNWVKS
jgi:hypothetical protein